MRRLAASILLCANLMLPAASRAADALPAACAAPVEFTAPAGSLDRLNGAIAAGGRVAILALGSATTVGSVNSVGEPTTMPQGGSFPSYMQQALHAMLPNVDIQLTVRGGRGMTAADMLVPLHAALQEQQFSLVLWQTGTVEALRGMRPDGLRAALRSGTEQVRAAGGDLVLIDPQYSRMLRANTDLDLYEAALQQAAAAPGVSLFHRFDLTRAWATGGQIDLERTPKDDRDRMLDALNMCLGQALARFVLGGARLPRN